MTSATQSAKSEIEMNARNELIFGWGAPSIKEQHPVLSEEIAERFDKDNMAVARLSVRGLLTMSQRDAAYKKLTKNIEATIRAALSKAVRS